MTIDRSFAAQPPPCIETLAPGLVTGETWGSVTVDLTKQISDRDICLAEVRVWIASERVARGGAAGT